MFNDDRKNYRQRYDKAIGFKSEVLGRFLFGKDVKSGTSLMRHAYELVEDNDITNTPHRLEDIKPFFHIQERASIALFDVSTTKQIKLFGMQQQDARILTMSRAIRQIFGDWRQEDQRHFPNNEMLHRGSLMQSLTLDTKQPVASVASYRSRQGKLYFFESVWFAVNCLGIEKPLVACIIGIATD